MFLVSWDLGVFLPIKIEFILLFDRVSLLFSAAVLNIRRFVILYSKYYMARERRFIRFHILVGLFVGAIIIFILRTNLVSIILG